MSGSKPRRGLSSFLSNELKESEAQVPEVAVAPEPAPALAPVEAVEAPREVVVTEVLIEVDEPARAVKPAKKPTVKASEAPVKPAKKPAAKLAKPTKKTAAKKTAAKATKKPAKKPAKKGKAAKKPAAKKTPKAPLYLRLTRKEARLREDQIDGLAKVARRLTRAKGGSGSERLTENTLLRVAVDLLLAHADELDGATESQLRASVLGK